MAQQPPAFTAQARRKAPRWRRTPPAIFPPILGLWGLATGWSRTPDAFGMPAGIGQILMGAMVLLFLYTGGTYLAKIIARPGVVVEDLKVLPGRAGLAALTMSTMFLGMAFIPYWPPLAKVILAIGIAGHAIVLALVIRNLLKGPAEGRVVTPVFHLTFVGFIVSPLGALQLGWITYSQIVFWATFAMALAIWAASAVQFARQSVPAPLRPLMAIHLAPASLLGLVAMNLGMGGLGLGLGLFAIVILAALLIGGRWITAAGFSPFWGAFTFPLASFASLMMVLGAAGYGEIFRYLGGIALVAATFFIPWIASKVLQLWIKGVLAEKTNSATA